MDLMIFWSNASELMGSLLVLCVKKLCGGKGHSSKALKLEDREQKREVDGGKEKDRCNLKHWGKSIQELDLSNYQHCTPSYRLLPEDLQIFISSLLFCYKKV